MTSDFIWHMKDVLDLYEQPYDPKRPVICFDERPCQLISDAIIPIPMKPDVPRKNITNISEMARAAYSLHLSHSRAKDWSVLGKIGRWLIMLIL